LERVVAAIGISGIIGLAHSADEMPRTAAIAHRGGKGKKQEITAGDKCVRQSARVKGYRRFAGQPRITDLAQHAQIDDMVLGELAVPLRKLAPQTLQHRLAAIELDTVALAVIETDGFDRSKARERPCEAGRRILAAG